MWRRELTAALALLVCTACAAPLQRPARSAPDPGSQAGIPARVPTTAGRPAIGVAFGGGSARGLAHVGVVRWFEDHRIPIDVAAGTSMGGLVGGAFASGMDAAELRAFVSSLDWDKLFGASNFAHKNIRRKADARAYPSRLEFGLKRGIAPPSALNSGQYVELLLGRITAPYFDIADFDALPTPFRTVAVDLLAAQPVVIGRGSLASAMRATMSLPFIFPPVEIDGRVLVDGGAMNNVPADVVRAMGADRVIAINVGDLSDREDLSYTMFGVAGTTLDAMMRASTRRALTSADIVINVPLDDYGSLDWRRAPELMDEGYRAAEAMREQLLPLAVTEAEFETWQRSRQARRRTSLPTPESVQLDGFAERDASRLEVLLARHVGVPVDIAAIEADLATITGLDRYETVTWSLARDASSGHILRVHGRVKPYAPPFMMLGVNLENTTSSDFRITATGRYLTFDLAGSGSELRLDATIGSNPSVAAEFYRPLGATPLFVAPYAGVGTATFNVIEDDVVVARYGQKETRFGLNVGVNLGARSDLRVGAYVARSSASIDVGNPGLPELKGRASGAEMVWRLDTQDSPVIPTSGLHGQVRLFHVFDTPDLAVRDDSFDLPASVTQLSIGGNQFWTAGAHGRLFAAAGAGTSFDRRPLPTSQFELGTPFRLGAYDAGELRGDHYYIVTGGYLQQVGQLPDFMGGPIFVGGWLENGDTFAEWSRARWRSNAGVGVVMDTLIGPVLVAGEWGFDGRWRTYLGVGRLFRLMPRSSPAQ